MKVLIIAHKPPYPKIDGGCVATAQIINGLELEGIDYRLIFLHTPKHPFLVESFPTALKEKILIAKFIDTQSVWRNLKQGLNTKVSIFTNRFYTADIEREIIQVCRDFQPNIVHFESLFAAVYLPAIRNSIDCKVVLRTHNIEHDLWVQRVNKIGFFKKKLLQKHVSLLKEAEIQCLKNVDGVLAIAKNEITFITQQGIKTKSLWLPMGIEQQGLNSHYGNDFFHLAAMDWKPNVSGLNWFLKNIWKEREISSSNILHIAGKNLNMDEYRDIRGVKNHGTVQSSERFMCDFGIMLVPLFEGSGLRIKIIQAGALGVPIIATSKAVEGIGLQHKTHFLQADTAEEFREAMLLLRNDVSLRRNLGQALKAYIKLNFNQKDLNQKLIEFYKSI